MSRGYENVTGRRASKPDAPQPIQWQPVVVPTSPQYQSLAQKMHFESEKMRCQPGESRSEWAERVRLAAHEAGVVGVEASERPQEEPVRVPTPPAQQARLPYAEEREPGSDDA